MNILFWVSITLITYTYIGYPVLIYILSHFYKKPLAGKYVYPTVSVLVAAHNEEERIEQKIKNLLELDYPEERIEILIGSDGSTDKTDEIVKRFSIDQAPSETIPVKFFRQDSRKGKPSVLNLLTKEATGEILVFTDTRQRLGKNAVKELVKYFSDRKVGSVSGELHFENEEESKAASGLGFYWKYEKFIRKSESRMGSMLGATGALYAIRRELFPVLPQDLILDDVYIPMKIVERGYRAIFDKRSLVYDRAFYDPKIEYSRKVRTLAGNYQLFYYLRELFNPFKGKISWQFFSHKFLRLMMPFSLIVLFTSNALLLSKGFLYQALFTLQAIFYLLAIISKGLHSSNKFLSVPYMFCVMNKAAVVGLYRFITKKQVVAWERAE